MRILLLSTLVLASTTQAQQAWTLDRCLQRAEQQNIAFRGELLNADLAGKASDQSKWALLPDLNAGATHGYNWGKAIDRYTNTFATERVRSNNLWLSSNWTLFQGMRLQNQRLKADIDADAAMKGLDASRNTIRKLVVSQFLSVLGLREGIKAAEQQAASTRTRIEATQALVDAGRVARAQLYDLQAQLAREEMSVVDLQNQEQQALLQLGQSLFLTPEEQRGFTITGPAITSLAITEPAANVDTLVARVLAADPAFARATLNVRSADRNVSIARSGSMPTLNLNASFGTGYSGLNSTPVGEAMTVNSPAGFTESGETVYVQNQVYPDGYEVTPFGTQLDDNLNRSVGLTLSVPIFNNMSNRLAIDQARVQREQAVLQQESERQRVQRDVQDALLQQRAAFRKYEAASRSFVASGEALRYAEERFTAGAITIADLELAKASVINATADVIRARYDWLMAAKSLDILMGLPVTL